MLILSMIITTLGENIVSPSSTTLVAKLSPENERGRYMGAFGIFSSFGWALGPAVGGLLYDGLSTEPLMMWGAIAAISMVSVFGYLYLGKVSGSTEGRAVSTSGAKG
jgi:MFS family permease